MRPAVGALVAGMMPALARPDGAADAADQFEVAHEALVRNWRTLVDWLDDDRSRRVERARLTTFAKTWLDSSRDQGALLGGEVLAKAEAANYDDLSQLEK